MKLEVGKYYRTRDGRKVGPMRDDGSKEFPFTGLVMNGIHAGQKFSFTDDGRFMDEACKADLIAEWADEPAAPPPAGPVRTITRKEIVPGVYGVVDLDGVDDNQVQIRLRNTGELRSWFDAAELRAAIATLSEIADAMEENSK